MLTEIMVINDSHSSFRFVATTDTNMAERSGWGGMIC